jgi:uncharacterized metal-binding protein
VPNAKKHKKINLILLPLLLVLIYFFYPNELHIIIGTLFYVYATFWFNPDADITNQTKMFSINGLMTLPMRLSFAPFFKHRGISHSFLGTLLRILCLGVFVLATLYLYLLVSKFVATGFITTSDLLKTLINTGVGGHTIIGFIIKKKAYFVAGLIGIIISDFVHILSDKIFKH